ncbi:hypothetical protein BG011_007940 [Mortierella polycephala]|uniref:Uncharacterized protein n=1 Tax=Mortierella polycephala TaxID=41804 RepID=A0A9P6U8L2_9FUNG|nr:hypothetical protein BG011_007940 [Mortierella polycephala]
MASYQTVRFNQSVRKVLVREDSDGQKYVLLEDIRNAFIHFGENLELNGVPVPLLEDEHQERIAYYSSETIAVVPESQQASQGNGQRAKRPRSWDYEPEASEGSAIATHDMQYLVILEELHKMQRQHEESERRENENQRLMLAYQHRIIELQYQTRDMVSNLERKVQVVLTQTFELHEYSSPRLFIVLPEISYQGINPASILNSFATTKFRLFFLCECGPHTQPAGQFKTNHIHIAKHEGYEITRPTEFFRKYGPHVLRLLRAIKYGVSVAGMVVPSLPSLGSIDLPQSVADDLDERMAGVIHLLSVKPEAADVSIQETCSTDLGDRLLGMDTRGDILGREETFVPLEGADLRLLDSFVRKKDKERTLGNLFRTVDDHGHVRWICSDHHNSTYLQHHDQEFERAVNHSHGQYDKHHGTVSVVLSSDNAEAFMSAMKRARGLTELDVHLYDFGYSVLKNLGEALVATNISKLTLACSEYWDIDLMSLGKRKLRAILKIIVESKVRHFHFKFIKGLFRAPGIQVPKDLPAIRSLELTGICLKDDHSVLKEMLQACRNMSVLRLTETSLASRSISSVMDGLSTCYNLSALSLHGCELAAEHVEGLVRSLQPLGLLKELDLSNNILGDSGCSKIIDAVGVRLEKLSLFHTGFGDASVRALERAASAGQLKSLDIHDHVQELEDDGKESLIRLMGLVRFTEVVMPSTSGLSDEYWARVVQAMDISRLEHFELQGSKCGDLTADALATMLGSSGILTRLRIDLPLSTLDGAQKLVKALGERQFVRVSLSGSNLFHPNVANPGLANDLLGSASSFVTTLVLKSTNLTDAVAPYLAQALHEANQTRQLRFLDLRKNKMTQVGGTIVLHSLHHSTALQTLRMESESFGKIGSMGPAVQQLLETNRSLYRLSVSHANLHELTLGLCQNEKRLKSLEIHHVEMDKEDAACFGGFLRSHHSVLQRIVVKHVRIRNMNESLKQIYQALEENKAILDVVWDIDHGDTDGGILDAYTSRNRRMWRKSPFAKPSDLVLAGVDANTAIAIRRGGVFE